MLGLQSEEVDSLRKLVEKLPQKSFVNDESNIETAGSSANSRISLSRRRKERPRLRDNSERQSSLDSNSKRRSARFKMLCQAQSASVITAMRAMKTVVK
jgi:hypothetical protein